MRSTAILVSFYINIFINFKVHQSGLGGPHVIHKCNRLIEIQYNDINVQHANITSSMKLHNTKLGVVGHYFCCTILWAAYYG